jgi:hypothetical protein
MKRDGSLPYSLAPILSQISQFPSHFKLLFNSFYYPDITELTSPKFSVCMHSHPYIPRPDLLPAARPRGRDSSPGGGKNFHLSKSSRPALGSAQPPIQWVPGALSPEVKRPGLEADHSPPASAEVKKMWIYTST